MDKEARETQAHHADADTPEDLSPLSSLESAEKPESKTKNSNEYQTQRKNVKEKYTYLIKVRAWFINKALEATLHDWLMILFTGVLTWVAIGQYFMAKRNATDSSAQINKIIDASNRIEDAADSFSSSSRHINDGIGIAVDKLQSQVDQVKRSGDLIKEANSYTTESERPWMGAVFTISNFDPGQKPTYVIEFTNSGKRPAIVRKVAIRAMPLAGELPANPDFLYKEFDDGPSTSFVVPGAVASVAATEANPIDLKNWELYTKSMHYYVFGKVEYGDPKTTKTHWTHFCTRFHPELKNTKDSGYRNCGYYNDAD